MKKFLLILKAIVLCILLASAMNIEEINRVPTSELTPYLINSEGYIMEAHTVVTNDGYILKMFRIPGSNENPPAKGKPIVFLMHGLLNSSKDWLVLGRNKSLPYILADAGFDVFLGNARGNSYSKRHTKYSTDGYKFWQFSSHHIGAYDIPAMIDFALTLTEQKSLHYIGHSQGSANFLIAASLYPEFNEKIRTMHGFAPVAFVSRMRSPGMRAIAHFFEKFETVLEYTGHQELISNPEIVALTFMNACREDSIFQEVCVNAIFLICGYDSELLNRTLLPLILRHSPTGASIFQLTHYGQAMRSGKFAWYDHGILKNLWIYGTPQPPEYDLQAVTAPVYLHYSDNDWIVSVGDVQELEDKLGNHVESRRVPHRKFNHLDYMYGLDVDKLLYRSVVETIVKDEKEFGDEWNKM